MSEPKAINKLFEYRTAMDSIDDAEDLLVIAKERMLHINQWHEHSPLLHNVFSLTDKQGKLLHRSAHKNDLVKITTEQENPAVWLYISQIVYDDYPDTSTEAFSVALRYTSSPPDKDTGAFSTQNTDEEMVLMIERHSGILSASLSATAGFQNKLSSVNWQYLLSNLLSIP